MGMVPLPFDGAPHTTSKSTSTAPKSPNKVPAKSGVGYTTYTHKCRHYGTRIEVADGVYVYCSSMAPTRKEGEFVPDWGLYADWGWKVADWRAEHIDWPDHNIPKNKTVAFEQIVDFYERMEEGVKVEIGCIGGHGRTGTILACFYVLGGKTAEQARQAVWSEYCKEAIEAKSQEWFVDWFECQITGKTPPEMPVSTYTSYSGGHNTTCMELDHFYPYLRSAVNCTKRGAGCTWGKKDVEKFKEMEKSGKWDKKLLDGQTIDWHRQQAKAHKKHPKEPTPKKKHNYGPSNSSLKTETIEIDGNSYKVDYGPEGHDELNLTTGKKGWKKRIKHNKLGVCQCDACRYYAAGHGYFLEPSKWQDAQEWKKPLDAAEKAAKDKEKLAEAEAQLPIGPLGPRQWVATGAKTVEPITPPPPPENPIKWFYDIKDERISRILRDDLKLPPFNPQMFVLFEAEVNGVTRNVRVSGEYVAIPTNDGIAESIWVFFPWKDVIDAKTQKIIVPINGSFTKKGE